ncbi:nucleotide exchange factor GrpE [Wenzhouxiangella sp. AB-CW3]|uniref:nucleotide exchange factor GrpE n=1 Tax=Wenzhouxiangella sp. AB-CW3 TaxID=2771012 RepID=UPI00168AB2D7|nr:nucleotide exchange factor GrpE [Wenzhouxiangella sp. AB-CW3]QOC23714.1 nucleotide exchange factor GrpE [Wenzhouxiangella sp. AB-CW3]
MGDPKQPHEEYEQPEASQPELDSTDDAGGDGHVSGDADVVPAEEVTRLRDALLRTRAEMDNMEKRSRRELEKARRFQLEGLMRELLPVIDALDQGLDGADGGAASSEGLTLTRRLLLKALEQYGLEVIEPVGERFDPQWHEAMSMQPSEDAEPDTVLAVLQKGYRLHDRLLRAARVIVARND